MSISEGNLPPLVTVIIPVYNRQATVGPTLMSVYENTHRPLEVIVVDDGSVDQSSEVVQEFIEQYSSDEFKIILKRQPNQGAPAARNNGLRTCSGQYVQFLDSDDFIDSKKLATQLATMREQNSDVCVCDFRVDYIGSNQQSEIIRNENPLRKMINGGSVGCSTCLMTHRLATAVNWTESLPNFQDIDYFLKIILLAQKITYLPEALYFYQIRDDISTISSVRKKSGAKVPYRQRMGSLLNDGILNNKYGATLKKFSFGSYAYLLLCLKRCRQTLTGK